MSWGFRIFICWHGVTGWVFRDIWNDCDAFVFNDPAVLFFPDWWTLHAEISNDLWRCNEPLTQWHKFMSWHSHCENLKCHNMCKCDCQCLYNQQNSLSALMFLELACILKASHNLYTLHNYVWFFLHLRVKMWNLFCIYQFKTSESMDFYTKKMCLVKSVNCTNEIPYVMSNSKY